jgi:signal transduction histidine kinase
MVNRDVTQTRLLNNTLLRAQRIETVGRLATSIAHDLNQVLSTLLITMRSLPLDQIDDNGVLKASQSCAEHGRELITQLLSIAKEVHAEPASLDLTDLIDEIANVLRSTFPRSIEIKLAIAPDLWPIDGNKIHLYQLLLNLCLNARDAMASGGTLTISANNVILEEMTAGSLGQAPGSYVLLTVADTGMGIPKEIATKVFEPFFTTKEPGRGAGLGLFTVASIVKNHGGFINLAAETNRGAQFMAYLPAKGLGASIS